MILRSFGLALICGLVLGGCSDSPVSPDKVVPDASGGAWRTWILESGSEFRPAPPPLAGSVRYETEILEILAIQRDASAESLAEVHRWAGSPTAPWTAETLHLLERYWLLLPDVRTASPAHSARIMALLHVAMYDAMVAAWDAKFAFGRPGPADADPRVKPLLRPEPVPSYPSEHAAAAAAAVAVLKYAFPLEDGSYFDGLAHRAGEARIAGGAAFRIDVEVGAELGLAVAERLLARARFDGSHSSWNGVVPPGEIVWRPTRPRFIEEPFDALAGEWRTWVIPSGDAFRPDLPPLPGSDRFERDLQELRDMPAQRTLQQSNTARFWATDAPSAWWEMFAEEEITRRELPALRAARAHTLVSIAIYDAFVAAWDAKYHYWLMRPVSADSTLQPLFSTPPFPSYPSGHSTISYAAAEVFAYLFPDRAKDYYAKAHEASESRIWGGVHYRFDIVAGEELGERVGRAVVEHARGDGSGS